LVLHIIYVVIHSIFFNKTNQEILTEKCVGAGFLSRAEREREREVTFDIWDWDWDWDWMNVCEKRER
jgi:hypothetical protein